MPMPMPMAPYAYAYGLCPVGWCAPSKLRVYAYAYAYAYGSPASQWPMVRPRSYDSVPSRMSLNFMFGVDAGIIYTPWVSYQQCSPLKSLQPCRTPFCDWCPARGTSHVLVVLALVASEVPEGNFFWGYLAAGATWGCWCYQGDCWCYQAGDGKSWQTRLTNATRGAAGATRLATGNPGKQG